MYIFICKEHSGVWLPGSSVVIAESEERARELLDAALVKSGLLPNDQSPYRLTMLHEHEQAVILWNGDYK